MFNDMKKLSLVILTLVMMFAGQTVFAQGKYGADSANCIKFLSYYKEYYKQKDYEDALRNWRKAYNVCPPTANQTMLIDGTSLMRYLIKKNKTNPVYVKALVDSLLTLHDVRVANYPKYAVSALNNKGLDMSNYIKDDPKRVFAGYNEIIETLGEQTKPQLFLFDQKAAIDLYNNGVISADDVIAVFERNSALLDKAPATSEIVQTQNAKIKTDMENLFIGSKVADCDKLLQLYGARFESGQDNLELVTKIVKMLSITEDCQDNDLYLNAVTSMYKLDPSYKSAYFLYKLHSTRGNKDAAIRYMEEAIASEDSDAATDASYNYELATFCFKNGMLSKAYAHASRTIDFGGDLAGKALFLAGQIWGSVACPGGDEISNRAHFWVAVDFLNKAKAADASLSDEANRLIASYAKYFPQTAEAFMYNVQDGQPYSVSCGGMSASTHVRTQK